MLFTLIEIFPGIAVYFVAIIGQAGDFALKLKLPFLTWMVCSGRPCCVVIPGNVDEVLNPLIGVR
ncbi:hypothetical protein [Pseudomonas putida]|uniref:hypothetical protein n=1 Tax=Pseudomonas putida TaxID=303 RepID=UPI00030EE87D|nr:hypothetical protein [Pseudomonas putida]